MKNVRLIAFALCVMMIAGCEKTPEDKPRDERLLLTMAKDTVACNARMGELTAMMLTWTAGTNHGTGSAIAYTIDMDMAGNAFAAAVHLEIGRTMDRTLALSHRQLADTLHAYFPELQQNEYEPFEIRVRAEVLMTGEEQVSPIVPFTLIQYEVDTARLYIVGDAAPNGWDKDHASMMQWDMSSYSLYTWTGSLRKGEFKLLTTTEDWFPCYVRNMTDDTKMVYREHEEDYPDTKWTITKAGKYTVTADTKTLDITVTYLGGESYSHIYMIGDATPGGWSWDNLTELSHPATDMFTYEGPLSAGAIKFPTEIKSDWSGEMLFAPTPDCAPSVNGTFDAHIGDPDNKWIIPSAGTWSITINMKDTTISFEKL